MSFASVLFYKKKRRSTQRWRRAKSSVSRAPIQGARVRSKNANGKDVTHDGITPIEAGRQYIQEVQEYRRSPRKGEMSLVVVVVAQRRCNAKVSKVMNEQAGQGT